MTPLPRHPLGRCPSCGSDGRRGRARQSSGLTLQRCARCDLVYTDPQPRETVDVRYLAEYDLADYFAPKQARKSVLFTRRLDALDTPRSGANRLLDVGCGDGLFLELARQRGWVGAGIELNPPAAARAAERGFEIEVGKVEDMPASGLEEFDVVTSWDSLEHTPEPAAFARRLGHFIRPGGRLYLTTLNRRSLVGFVFRDRWSMVLEDHFTYWNPKSLAYVVRAAGLELESMSSAGIGRDFLAWVDRLRPAVPKQGSPTSPRGGGVPRWDTSPVVLRAERLLNGSLDATKLGVELGVTASKAL